MQARHRGFIKDMDKTVLLKMRDDEGMTLQEIASAVGCSKTTISSILGPMPEEMRKQRKRAAGMKTCAARWLKSTEGGVHRGTESAEHDAAA